jgi:energy-converting hydrogenase Eha subunit A
MKRSATVFLQVVIVLIGIGALAFMLWEPHVEGANAHATLSQMYFNSFVVYAFIGSTPFFAALYHAFRVLGYVRQNKTFSQATVNSLRIIKYCALALIGFVVVSVVFMIGGDREDRPAGFFMRILVIFPSIIVAIAAAISERVFQNAVDKKPENDLIV